METLDRRALGVRESQERPEWCRGRCRVASMGEGQPGRGVTRDALVPGARRQLLHRLAPAPCRRRAPTVPQAVPAGPGEPASPPCGAPQLRAQQTHQLGADRVSQGWSQQKGAAGL